MVSWTIARQPGRADLARMGEGGGQRVVHGRLEVGVVEHDVGALAAHLERDLLEIDRRAAQHRPARLEPAGQRHEVDVAAVGQRLSDASAGAEHEVDDTRGNAGLLEQAGQVDRRQRRDLGRLHDRRVPGGESRRDLPAELEERVVPRPDQPAHADRLVDDPADGVWVAGVDQPACVLVGEIGVVAEDARDVRHIPTALAHRLAGVDGLEPGQLLEVAVDQAGDPVEQRRAFVGRRPRPVGLIECSTGGRDGGLDLVVGRDVDLGDDRCVGRVDDRAALAVRRCDPLAVDVETRHADLCWRFGGSIGGGRRAVKTEVRGLDHGGRVVDRQRPAPQSRDSAGRALP